MDKKLLSTKYVRLHLYQDEKGKFSGCNGMQEHANHVSGSTLSTFCEVHARKSAFRYPGTVLGKGQSFWKMFTNVKMVKMKNNTITVIWFLDDVQNYADLRWDSFYSIWIIFHIVLYLIQ